MNGFFSGNNKLFRFCTFALDIVVLSLMWIVCSLPVITIGPATAALYYSCVKCLRYQEPGPYTNFISSFKENLRTGVGLTIVFLIVAVLLRGGYQLLDGVFPDSGTVSALVMMAYLLFLLFPIGVFSCAVALLSRFGYSVGGLIRDSIRITFKHLSRLLLVAVVNTAAVILSVRYFYFLVWLVIPSADALIVSRFIEPLLRRYTPKLEELEELPPEERPWYLR